MISKRKLNTFSMENTNTKILLQTLLKGSELSMKFAMDPIEYDMVLEDSNNYQKRNDTNDMTMLSFNAIQMNTFIQTQKEALEQSMKILKEMNNHELMLNILYLAEEQEAFPLELVNTIYQQLFIESVSCEFIDHGLSVAYLTSLPCQDGFETFRKCLMETRFDYKRLYQVAKIGMMTGILWKQPSFYQDCKELQDNAYWWNFFQLLQIDFSEVEFLESGDRSYHHSLVPVLLQKTNLDLFLTIEFCECYGIGPDLPKLLFIQLLLLSNDSEDEDVSDYQDKILAVMDEIDTQDVLHLFKDICYKNVNQKDYRKLEYVCNQIIRLESGKIPDEISRDLIILSILENYDKQFCNSETIEYSKIPFHDLMEDPWTVLRPLISEITLNYLLPLVSPLDLSVDQFYRCVFDNLINNQQNISHDSVQKLRYYVDLIRNEYLRIQLYLKICEHMESGTESHSLAQTALQMIAQALLSLQDISEDDEEYHAKINMQIKFQKLRLTCEKLDSKILTSWQLKLNGITGISEQLFNDIPELICRLYQSQSISYLSLLKKKKKRKLDIVNFSDNQPEIYLDNLHLLINDIAARHQLNADKIRSSLIQFWLLSNPEDEAKSKMDGFKAHFVRSKKKKIKELQNNLDSKSNLTTNNNQKQNINPQEKEEISSIDNYILDQLHREEEKNIELRLEYLLTYGKIEKNLVFLLNYAYQKTTAKTTPMSKARSIKLAFTIGTHQQITSLFKNDISKLYSRMQLLFFCSEFSKISMEINVKQLSSVNKEDLVIHLLTNYSQNIQACIIASQIMFDFKINNQDIWQKLFTKLVDLKLISIIFPLFLNLSRYPQIQSLPNIKELFQRSIMFPIEELMTFSKQKKEQTKSILGNSKFLWRKKYEDQLMRLVVDLIVSSPYLFDLDLPLFVRDFTVLGSAENASRCFYLFAKMPQTKKHEELIVFFDPKRHNK
eukprot:Anaeramoba_ignava/c21138_g1_i1.p1 GENE.c21138_g1_i1~~c21138_g1_i1.p1  ORF type:complete len:962 (+),score=240.05 c21138_g1_i1:34-2886(+)